MGLSPYAHAVAPAYAHAVAPAYAPALRPAYAPALRPAVATAVPAGLLGNAHTAIIQIQSTHTQMNSFTTDSI